MIKIPLKGLQGLAAKGIAKKPVLSPREIAGMKKAISESGFYKTAAEKAKALEGVKKWMAGAGGAKGAIAMKALGTLGAGALVAGAWAYPAHRLGKALGKKIEEKKVGKPKVTKEEYEKKLLAIRMKRKKKRWISSSTGITKVK